MRPIYAKGTRGEKASISWGVAEEVLKKGGRFLKKRVESGRWYLADDQSVRTKVSQALREKCVTSEARAAKRAKYLTKTMAATATTTTNTTTRAMH